MKTLNPALALIAATWLATPALAQTASPATAELAPVMCRPEAFRCPRP